MCGDETRRVGEIGAQMFVVLILGEFGENGAQLCVVVILGQLGKCSTVVCFCDTGRA